MVTLALMRSVHCYMYWLAYGGRLQFIDRLLNAIDSHGLHSILYQDAAKYALT